MIVSISDAFHDGSSITWIMAISKSFCKGFCVDHDRVVSVISVNWDLICNGSVDICYSYSIFSFYLYIVENNGVIGDTEGRSRRIFFYLLLHFPFFFT